MCRFNTSWSRLTPLYHSNTFTISTMRNSLVQTTWSSYSHREIFIYFIVLNCFNILHVRFKHAHTECYLSKSRIVILDNTPWIDVSSPPVAKSFTELNFPDGIILHDNFKLTFNIAFIRIYFIIVLNRLYFLNFIDDFINLSFIPVRRHKCSIVFIHFFYD